jgi:hypothetical protein
MSQNYDRIREPKNLNFKGLVMVLQVENDLDVELSCILDCRDSKRVSLIVKEGGTLVFSTDVWKFSYFPSVGGESVTFVTETNWNP